jgi:hypothetical protein
VTLRGDLTLDSGHTKGPFQALDPHRVVHRGTETVAGRPYQHVQVWPHGN